MDVGGITLGIGRDCTTMSIEEITDDVNDVRVACLRRNETNTMALVPLYLRSKCKTTCPRRMAKSVCPTAFSRVLSARAARPCRTLA